MGHASILGKKGIPEEDLTHLIVKRNLPESLHVRLTVFGGPPFRREGKLPKFTRSLEDIPQIETLPRSDEPTF
jgi:hypothetical protein